jgi:predicted RNA binding protein YcfA (HicA-like mRNA interferase family)
MNRRKLLKKLSEGHFANIPFNDMIYLAEGFGFQVARISGSHHILNRAGIPELVNLQEVQGKAKPYQVRQFLRLVEMHNLRLEPEA